MAPMLPLVGIYLLGFVVAASVLYYRFPSRNSEIFFYSLIWPLGVTVTLVANLFAIVMAIATAPGRLARFLLKKGRR